MSNRLLFLSGLAILMISVQHATAYGLQAMFSWSNSIQTGAVTPDEVFTSLPYYVTMILRQLAAFAVPGFLFISGYFLAFMARGKNSKVTFQTMLPRIKILLPPFFIWTIIRFAMLRSIPASVEDFFQPYHFIPLLIQFYLIAPLLVPLARKHPVFLLLAFGAMQLGVQYFRYLDDLGMQLTGLSALIAETPRWLFFGQQPFWFPLGLVVGLHTQSIVPRLVKMRWALVAMTVLLAILSVVEYFVADRLNGEIWIGPSFSGFIRNFYILFMILALISIDIAASPVKSFIQTLGSQSLGIYLANIPSIYAVALLMYHLTPWALEIQVIYQVVLTIAGLAIPLLLMRMVRSLNSLRPSYRYIFG